MLNTTDRTPKTFLSEVRGSFIAFWRRTDLPFKMFLIGVMIGMLAHDLLVSLPLRLFGIGGGCL